MALVVLPEGQQRSGSIGGTVWSHNSAGAYIRNRSIPVNTNTDRQVAARNLVRSLAIAWNTLLTQPQRDAWNVYAANVTWINALGQTIQLTGLNHFIRSNSPRMQCELARIDDAPTIFNIAAAEPDLAASAAETTQILSIEFDPTGQWAAEDGGFQIFSMGIPQNASIKFFGGPWRILCCSLGESIPQSKPGTATGPPKQLPPSPKKPPKALPAAAVDAPKTPPVSPLDCPAVWPIAEGQRLWLRSRIGRADGRLSQFAQANFLCGT